MFYQVYGLRLVSNAAIPGLSPAPFAELPDIRITLNKLPVWWDGAAATQRWVTTSAAQSAASGVVGYRLVSLNGGSHTCLSYSDGVEFIFDATGSEIWVNWPAAMAMEDMAAYLVGPILGLMLRLRGCVCLHASAIAVGGRAIAFLGPAGAGKSTTAAAFAKLGFPVLSDDIVTLDDRGDGYWVQPGDPRIRLWPQSVQMLYGCADRLPRMTPTWEKRYLDLRQAGYRFARQPLPLAAIYVLDERLDAAAAPLVQAVERREGLITLVANSFANSLLDRTMRADEFGLLGRLVQTVALRKLRSHTEPGKLARLCEVVLDDWSQLVLALRSESRPQEAGHV